MAFQNALTGDFVFDNQIPTQCMHSHFRIGEVSCPTKYFKEASSISFRRSVTCGMGVLWNTMCFALRRFNSMHFRAYDRKGRKLEWDYYGRCV
jgi:hypothetical protein